MRGQQGCGHLFVGWFSGDGHDVDVARMRLPVVESDGPDHVEAFDRSGGYLVVCAHPRSDGLEPLGRLRHFESLARTTFAM